MGRQIIKCAPGEDLYMEWWSDVEAPAFFGDRAGTLDYLTEEQEHTASNPPEARLRRADERGTSMLDRSGCDWDSPGLIYKQSGHLPRARFAEFARRYLDSSEDEPDVADLLDPLKA